MTLQEARDTLNAGIKCDVAVTTEIRLVNVVSELVEECARLNRRVAQLEDKADPHTLSPNDP